MQKSKPMYRIEIRESETILERIALSAAFFNGGKNTNTLENFKTMADGYFLQWPTLYPTHKAEIIGGKVLHIDCQKDGEPITILVIQEVEIFDISQTPEEETKEWEGNPIAQRQGFDQNELLIN